MPVFFTQRLRLFALDCGKLVRYVVVQEPERYPWKSQARRLCPHCQFSCVHCHWGCTAEYLLEGNLESRSFFRRSFRHEDVFQQLCGRISLMLVSGKENNNIYNELHTKMYNDYIPSKPAANANVCVCVFACVHTSMQAYACVCVCAFACVYVCVRMHVGVGVEGRG